MKILDSETILRSTASLGEYETLPNVEKYETQYLHNITVIGGTLQIDDIYNVIKDTRLEGVKIESYVPLRIMMTIIESRRKEPKAIMHCTLDSDTPSALMLGCLLFDCIPPKAHYENNVIYKKATMLGLLTYDFSKQSTSESILKHKKGD